MSGSSSGDSGGDDTPEENLNNLDPGYKYTAEENKLMEEKIPRKL